MSLWQAVVLGLVQGLTEFLPVSSSGHLVLAERLVGLDPPGLFVEVSLHAATLTSVLVVYGTRLLGLTVGVMHRRAADLRYVGLLLLGTIPAALVGLTLQGVIERAFDSLVVVGLGLTATGFMLWSTRRRVATPDAPGAPNAPGALGIGAAQALAILPGVSRSGTTVAAGLWLGLPPARAAEFSFLLAVPAILGAVVLQTSEAITDARTVGVVPLLISCTVALVSGIWAIRFLVALLVRGRFYAFAPYCWGVGLLTLGVALWRT